MRNKKTRKCSTNRLHCNDSFMFTATDIVQYVTGREKEKTSKWRNTYYDFKRRYLHICSCMYISDRICKKSPEYVSLLTKLKNILIFEKNLFKKITKKKKPQGGARLRD